MHFRKAGLSPSVAKSESDDASAKVTFEELIADFHEKDVILASDDFWDKFSQSKNTTEENALEFDDLVVPFPLLPLIKSRCIFNRTFQTKIMFIARLQGIRRP